MRDDTHLVPDLGSVWHVEDGKPLGGRAVQAHENVRWHVVLQQVTELIEVLVQSPGQRNRLIGDEYLCSRLVQRLSGHRGQSTTARYTPSLMDILRKRTACDAIASLNAATSSGDAGIPLEELMVG